MLVLIDGDPPVYASGFSAQKTHYYVHGAHFETKREAFEYCKAEMIPPSEITSDVEAEDVSHALHNAKRRIEGIVEATGADEYIVYLTGSSNYREELVDYYKKNRKADKPVHYQAIRDYFVKTHGAVVVEGMEADDMLGIVQTQSAMHGIETCIATIDKDLNTIEGLHYNWTKDLVYNVTKEEADLFLYTQMLTGDTVDNIKGIRGIGPKKAEKILAGASTELELFRRVQNEYINNARKNYTDEEEGPSGVLERTIFEDGMSYLMENANLLYILKHPDERYCPPTTDL